MFYDGFVKAKRAEPFEPFRVTTSTNMIFDIRYRDHFLVLTDWVVLGIADPFRRDMLDRTFHVHLSHILSVEPLPIPQTQANGST